MASCCLMRPSFRSPGRALGTSGFTDSVEKLRVHFDDQIWSLLLHIQQRAKISDASAYELDWNWTGSCNLRHYTMFCASETKIKNGLSWIHIIHFEVANMPNIPTHSPEIPLRRKFSCLSARVVRSSSVSAMIAAASCSPQNSICISLAPLRSSASASPFLSGVPYNQHHYHHSSSRSKKTTTTVFLERCFVAGFKDTTPLPNIVSIVCQGKGNCSRNWKQQSKKMQ